MNSQPRITLKRVAAEAGVHVSTAWRALKSDTYVEPSKRKRIREIADRLGYVPDPMLSALSHYRRKQHPPAYRSTLAWVNTYPRRSDCLAAAHIRAYMEGATAFAESMGFRLEEFWLNEPGMTPKRAREVLTTRNIRCLLFAPQPSASAQVSLDLDAFACVSLGYSLTVPRLHVVTSHHHSSTLTALRKLCELGHHRIGMVSASETLRRVEHHFETPYHFFQQTRPEAARIPLFVVKGQDVSAEVAPYKERFLAWYRRYKPTAIISSISEIADWLREANHPVPGDVSLVTLSRIHDQRWAGIDQQEKEIGARAVELLISLFNSEERGVPPTPLRLLIEGRWQDGPTLQSVGPTQHGLLESLD